MNNNKKPTEKQVIGRLGEDLAAEYLKKNKFKIKEINYWKPWGEIDIIAVKNDILHFVEVKTVTVKSVNHETYDRYEPEDNIQPWKLRRLYRTIESYLEEKKIDDEADWQLDVMAVYLDPQRKLLQIEYLPDI
ncbi:MAG: YraN family protein [Candidatus Paceibacterota bacterium]